MSIVLVIDEETTGLDFQSDRVIEVGAVLWDTEAKKPLKILNHLLDAECINYEVPEKIVELTGITGDDLFTYGKNRRQVFEETVALSSEAEYMIAHNAPFDRTFLEKEVSLHLDAKFDHDWIDTRTDVPWRTKGSRSLSYLAADHGFLNPFAHRALFDVMTLCKLISMYDFNEILERSKYPLIRIIADVGYQNRELAKSKGFYWNGDKKYWFMDIKECDLKKVAVDFEFNFQTEMLEV